MKSEKEQILEQEKKAAALRAADLVADGALVGLGSGSTAAYLIEELGRRKQNGQINIKAVTSSYESRFLAHRFGIEVLVLTGISSLVLAIDGADEIDKNGNAIKGKGGAQVLEKVLASLSDRYILIADNTKPVDTLGRRNPVPIELIPESLEVVRNKLASTGCKLSVREGSSKVGPVVTDLGNIIIEAYFDGIENPLRLAYYLNNIPGVLGHGLFVNIVDQAIVGFSENGAVKTELRNFKRKKEPDFF